MKCGQNFSASFIFCTPCRMLNKYDMAFEYEVCNSTHWLHDWLTNRSADSLLNWVCSDWRFRPAQRVEFGFSGLHAYRFQWSCPATNRHNRAYTHALYRLWHMVTLCEFVDLWRKPLCIAFISGSKTAHFWDIRLSEGAQGTMFRIEASIFGETQD